MDRDLALPASAGAIPLRQGAMPLNPATKADQDGEALRSAARAFESIFVKTLLDSAFKEGFAGMGESGQADQINSMWTRQLADSLTAGEGLGLQAALLRGMAGAQSSSQGIRQGLEAYKANAVTPLDTAAGQAVTRFDGPESFVAALRPHVEKAAQDLGVSPRILLAQAALETGWGAHAPGQQGSSHNIFGIKADASWTGNAALSSTREFAQGEFRVEKAAFRSYASPAHSVSDYVDFLRSQPRYAQALNHGGSDEAFIRGLQQAGYATDPHYADRVLEVAESRWLNSI